MPITVACDCGKRFGVRDEAAGKRVRCPGCSEPVNVPVVALAAIDTSELVNAFVPSAKTSKRPFWKDPVLIVGASVPSLILFVFLGYLYKQKADKDFRDHTYTMKATADALAAAGQTRQAYDAYRAIISEAEGRFDEDSQFRATIETARLAVKRLEPLVTAGIAAAEMLREAEDKRRRVREAHAAYVSALATIKGDIRGTVFITLKNGSHQVLPGIKVSLLRAEIPKREIGDVIGNVRIVEGITRIESTGKLLSDEEFAFLEESITRAQILKTMPDDELVDVRLLYAVGWVNRMTSGEKGLPYAKVWPVVSKAATVAEEFTSVDGKFKFEDVVGGLYYLSAEYTLNRSIIEWVVPVELSKVSGKQLDLHNNVATMLLNLDSK